MPRVLPSQYILQYAGSMGFISAGAGYANKKDNLNLSFHYGYVPEGYGGRLDILTSRLVYKPFSLRLTHTRKWTPVNPAAFVTYTLNDGFYVSWPKDQYPENYYWWSSAIRLHMGVNSELTFLSTSTESVIKGYACYIEINTNDLYLASYVSNRNYLSLYDIIKIGAGIKLNLK